MIKATTMLGALAIAASAIAGPQDTDVRELLRAVDKATKEVDAVSYHAKRYGTGALATRVPTAKGEMLIVKNLDSDYFPAKAHATGQNWPVGETEAIAFNVAFDGETGYSLDDQAKKLTKAKGERGADLMGPGQTLFMLEYAHPTPFSDEINSDFAEIEGKVVVGDVLCNVVYVEYGGPYGDAKARWYFGVEDNLPRKVERLQQIDGRAGSAVTVLWDLDVNPEYSPSELSIEAPSGYAENTLKARPALIKAGATAPGFKLPDPSGEKHSLASYEGNVVLLDFWATWCGPCKAAMPSIQAIHEKFSGDKVKVIGLATWESGDPQAYMEENEYTYDLLLDADDVAFEYGVTGIPTLVLIDQEGTVLHVGVGFGKGEKEHLTELIEKALKGGGA